VKTFISRGKTPISILMFFMKTNVFLLVASAVLGKTHHKIKSKFQKKIKNIIFIILMWLYEKNKEKIIHVNHIKIIIIRLFNSKTIKLYFFNKIIGSYIIVKKNYCKYKHKMSYLI
jgi:hypothetical protein